MTKSIFIFKIKFIKSEQPLLPFHDIKTSEMFKIALEQKPKIPSRYSDAIWHIGNIVYVDEFSGTFRFGKQIPSEFPVFDENSKNFSTENVTEAPNCLIYFNLEYELLGISSSSKLKLNKDEIASRLKEVFQNTKPVFESETSVEISPVKNPKTFIEHLKSAHKIKNFTIKFSGPNPFDADSDFHKPQSAYLKAIGGKEGKTSISGDSLNTDVCVIMAKSVSGTGNDAYAKIQETSYDDAHQISLSRSPLKINLTNDDIDQPKSVIEKILTAYRNAKK